MKRYSYKHTLTNAEQIYGALSINEGKLLYLTARYGPKKGEIVEIGSFKGKSTIYLASGSLANHREKITAIDPHKGGFIIPKKYSAPTYKEFIKNLRKYNLIKWVNPIRKYSYNAVKKWYKPIRLLFIDGNHTYNEVSKDITNWQQFLVPGGIILFHDTLNPEIGSVKAILKHLVNKNEYKNLGFIDSIFFAEKGKPTNLFEYFNFYCYKFVLVVIYYLFKISINIPIKKVKIFLQQYIMKRYVRRILTALSKTRLTTKHI